MRHIFAAHAIRLTFVLRKMQKAADVIILVERGKQILRFLGAITKFRKRHWISETAGQPGITLHYIA